MGTVSAVIYSDKSTSYFQNHCHHYNRSKLRRFYRNQIFVMETFCLKWQNFEFNLANAFQDLRSDVEFFDVTLACDDKQIDAHKVVLSACSSFFREILKKYKHPHPLVYLKGVKFSQIVALLNFISQGEVNVAQEDLSSFLAVAEDLKVKGLSTKQVSLAESQQKISTKTNCVQKNIFQKQKDQEQPSSAQLPLLKRARKSNEGQGRSGDVVEDNFNNDKVQEPRINPMINVKVDPGDKGHSSDIIVPQAGLRWDSNLSKEDIADKEDNNKITGYDEIWSKLEKSGKIIRCRICGLNKHQDFFATLVNHIKKDHL